MPVRETHSWKVKKSAGFYKYSNKNDSYFCCASAAHRVVHGIIVYSHFSS